MKITVNTAVGMVPVSRATLYADIKAGKVSSETDNRGKKVVDVAELQRFYGELNYSESANIDLTEPPQIDDTGHLQTAQLPVDKVFNMLQTWIDDLRQQLRDAGNRQAALVAERDQLRLMLEQAEKRIKIEQHKQLMLPAPKSKRWSHIFRFI